MGSRTDVDEIRVMIDEGTPMLDIARANFPLFCRSYRAFQVYETLSSESSRSAWRHVAVVILAGCTGSGKTKLAMSYSPYKIMGSEKGLEWFDGYRGEDVLLIDEFDDSAVALPKMLSLLDGHKLRLPIKGGHTYAGWTKIFITTNQVSPLYGTASPEHLAAFNRRVSQTFTHFHESDPPFPSDIIWSNYVQNPIILQ